MRQICQVRLYRETSLLLPRACIFKLSHYAQEPLTHSQPPVIFVDPDNEIFSSKNLIILPLCYVYISCPNLAIRAPSLLYNFLFDFPHYQRASAFLKISKNALAYCILHSTFFPLLSNLLANLHVCGSSVFGSNCVQVG